MACCISSTLCDPATDLPVIVGTDLEDGTTSYFNADGSAFTGDPATLVACLPEETPLVVTINGAPAGVTQSGTSDHIVDLTIAAAPVSNKIDSDGVTTAFDPAVDCIPAGAFQKITDHHGHSEAAAGCDANELILHRTLGIGPDTHLPGGELGVLHSDSDDAGITGITNHHAYAVSTSQNSTATGLHSHNIASRDAVASGQESVNIGAVRSTASFIVSGNYTSYDVTASAIAAVNVGSNQATASGSWSGNYSSRNVTATTDHAVNVGSLDSTASGPRGGNYSSVEATAESSSGFNIGTLSSVVDGPSYRSGNIASQGGSILSSNLSTNLASAGCTIDTNSGRSGNLAMTSSVITNSISCANVAGDINLILNASKSSIIGADLSTLEGAQNVIAAGSNVQILAGVTQSGTLASGGVQIRPSGAGYDNSHLAHVASQDGNWIAGNSSAIIAAGIDTLGNVSRIDEASQAVVMASAGAYIDAQNGRIAVIASEEGFVTGNGFSSAVIAGYRGEVSVPSSISLSGGHANVGPFQTLAHGTPTGGTANAQVHVGFRGVVPVVPRPVATLADVILALQEQGLAL